MSDVSSVLGGRSIEITHVINIQKDKVSQGYQNLSLLKAELKKNREALKDAYSNDRDYHEIETEIKDMKAKLNARKKTLEQENESIIQLKHKVENMTESVHEEQLNFSDWLREYESETKQKTVEIQGMLFEIDTVAKLRKTT
mgnify:FL=1